MPSPFDADPQMAAALAKLLLVPYALGINTAIDQLPGVEVSFDVGNPRATRWLAQRSADLIRDMNVTTRDKLRAALAAGDAAGESRNQIAQRIRDTFASMTEYRSRLIAQTESINAYSQASLATMRQAVSDGVPLRKQWLAAGDACPLCKPLDNEIVGIDENFSYGGQGPTRHPACRCALRSVYNVGQAPQPQLQPSTLGSFDPLRADGIVPAGFNAQSFKGPWGAGAKIRDWQSLSQDMMDGKFDWAAAKGEPNAIRVAWALKKIGEAAVQPELVRGLSLSKDNIASLQGLFKSGDPWDLPLSSFSKDPRTAAGYAKSSAERLGQEAVVVRLVNAPAYDFRNNWEFVSAGRFRVGGIKKPADAGDTWEVTIHA